MNTPDIYSIKKVLANQASKQEASRVIKWFSTPEGQSFLSKEIDSDLQHYSQEMANMYLEKDIPSSEMYNNIIKKIRYKQRRKWIFKVAILLLPAILLISQFVYFSKQIDFFGKSSYIEVFAPRGEKLHVAFQDGSQVILNSGSRLKYPNKFSFKKREVVLMGEGYFKITKNATCPFIVNTNNLQVQVKGTTFNVKAYHEDKEIEVFLESGKVSLLNGNTMIKELQPGEQAHYDKQTGVCTISKITEVALPTKWIYDTVSFDNTSLSEVLVQLSNKFGVKFIIRDPQVFSYNYTLTTQYKNLEDIIGELNKLSPVKFRLHHDTIWVEKLNKFSQAD